MVIRGDRFDRFEDPVRSLRWVFPVKYKAMGDRREGLGRSRRVSGAGRLDEHFDRVRLG